jgi:hypothetical protein
LLESVKRLVELPNFAFGFVETFRNLHEDFFLEGSIEKCCLHCWIIMGNGDPNALILGEQCVE